MSKQQVLDILQPLRTQMLQLIARAGDLSCRVYDDETVLKDDNGFWRVFGDQRVRLESPGFPLLALVAQSAAADLAARAQLDLQNARRRAANEIVAAALLVHDCGFQLTDSPWKGVESDTWTKLVQVEDEFDTRHGYFTVAFGEHIAVKSAQLTEYVGGVIANFQDGRLVKVEHHG